MWFVGVMIGYVAVHWGNRGSLIVDRNMWPLSLADFQFVVIGRVRVWPDFVGFGPQPNFDLSRYYNFLDFYSTTIFYLIL